MTSFKRNLCALFCVVGALFLFVSVSFTGSSSNSNDAAASQGKPLFQIMQEQLEEEKVRREAALKQAAERTEEALVPDVKAGDSQVPPRATAPPARDESGTKETESKIEATTPVPTTASSSRSSGNPNAASPAPLAPLPPAPQEVFSCIPPTGNEEGLPEYDNLKREGVFTNARIVRNNKELVEHYDAAIAPEPLHAIPSPLETKEGERGPSSSSSAQAMRDLIRGQGPCRSSEVHETTVVTTTVCTRPHGSGSTWISWRMVQEFVLWHKILGATRVHVFVQNMSSFEKGSKMLLMPEAVAEELGVSFLQDDNTLLSVQCEKSIRERRGKETRAEPGNADGTKARRSFFLTLAHDEFLMLHNTSANCINQFVLSTAIGPSASSASSPHNSIIPVIPKVHVGHNNDLKFTSRTQFDRTMFGMGSYHQGNTLPEQHGTIQEVGRTAGGGGGGAPAAAAYVWVGDHRPFDRSGAPPSPGVFNEARVIKYAARQLPAHLRVAATRCNASFDMKREKQLWHQQRKVGFVDLPHFNPRLRELYVFFIKTLGYSGYRGDRAAGGNRALHGTSYRMIEPYLEAKPLKKDEDRAEEDASTATSSTVNASAAGAASSGYVPASKVYNKVTDRMLLTGEVRIRPEMLLHAPLHKDRILSIRERSPCYTDQKERRIAQAHVNITFCGYVRNRAKLTVEWVLWHHILGVEHFIVFDDHSEDDLVVAMQPLIQLGLVRILSPPLPPYRFLQHPVGGGLLAAYGECARIEVLEAHRSSPNPLNKYIGYIDPDEFMFIRTNEVQCLPSLVHRAIAKNPAKNGGVSIPWREVGHNGEAYDNFQTQFLRTSFGVGKKDHIERVKGIVRADLVVGMDTAHLTLLAKPYRMVFTTGKPLVGEGWWSGVKEDSDVYRESFLLHYHARSLSSWVQRYVDGFADDDTKVWAFSVDTCYGWWRGGLKTGFTNNFHFNDTKGMWDKHELLVHALT